MIGPPFFLLCVAGVNHRLSKDIFYYICQDTRDDFMNCNRLVFSDHAISQMFKRNISVDAITSIIENNEVINEYPNDKPYPSFLLLGYINSRAIHVVLGRNIPENLCIVITAYEPTLDIWENDYKRKRR